MSNAKAFQVKTLGAPARDAGATMIWEGYEDKRRGLGFPQEYDGWPELRQRRYERGRMYATIKLAANGEIKPWHRGRLLRRHSGAEVALLLEERPFLNGETQRKGAGPCKA